jgi:RNA polymerase primary sigma factor
MSFQTSSFDEASQRLIAQARNAPFLAKGEDRQLGLAIKAGGRDGEKARARLIASHERLVVTIACQYLKSGKSLSELIMEGKIGLVIAADKYDPNRGFNFSTYATWWIKAQVRNCALSGNGSADAPPSAKRKLFKIQQAERKLLEGGGPVSDAAIAEELGMSELTVQRLREAAPGMAQSNVSLDEIVGEGKATRGELLEDTSCLDPDQAMQRAKLNRTLAAALESLDERERTVLSLRFGLIDDEVTTLATLAKAYAMTPEGVRQIEKKALEKIAGGPHAMLLRAIMQDL